MDTKTLYEYAYQGVIERILILTKLYNMCAEAGDGDAMDEYLIAISKTKSDFDFIISVLGFDRDECWECLNWEIERMISL